MNAKQMQVMVHHVSVGYCQIRQPVKFLIQVGLNSVHQSSLIGSSSFSSWGNLLYNYSYPVQDINR